MSSDDSVSAQPDLSLFGDEHVARYEETDGEIGYLWNGAACLVLHTTGRTTGQLRKFALIFGERGGDLVLVRIEGRRTGASRLVSQPRRPSRLRGAGEG